MRIVAGEFRGRVLNAPEGKNTRPTTDRVRESLFNALCARMDLEGCNVLDAFAGSGALGLEALSRGATHVTFCERDARAISSLKGNVESLGVQQKCTLLRTDVLNCAPETLVGQLPPKNCASAMLAGQDVAQSATQQPAQFSTQPATPAPRTFDLVFLDPPYAMLPADVGKFLRALEGAEIFEKKKSPELQSQTNGSSNGVLSNGAFAVYEHDKHADIQSLTDTLGETWQEITTKTYGKTGVTLFAVKENALPWKGEKI